ncbi:MAG: hypothetical protein Q9208_002101 [Pyrenodesmia sp. 3 TL-2023]
MEDYTSPKDNSTAFSRASETVQFLEKQLPEALRRPRLGVICGSGLGSLAETVLPQPTEEVPYTSIPHFPSSSVQGHAGKLVFGLMQKERSPVVFMVGRVQSVNLFEPIPDPSR